MEKGLLDKMKLDLDTLRKQKTEIDQTQAKLATDILEIETALKVFNKYHLDDPITNAITDNVVPQNQTDLVQNYKSKRDKVVYAAIAILADGQSRHTADLCRLIQNQGLQISEANLSSYLSKAKTTHGLENSRMEGWSLKKSIKEESLATVNSKASV